MQTGTIRSKYILGRVRDILGLKDESRIGNDQIFAIATEKSRDLAESLMIIESSMSLSIVANTNTYDLTTSGGNPTGFYRVKLIAPPLTDRTTMVELDRNEIDFYQRYTRVSTGLPIWYYSLWGGTMTMYPIPTASSTWTIYFYKSPTTVISKSVAPETPSSFDSTIVYGTVAELAPMVSRADLAQNYIEMYIADKQRAIEAFRATRTENKQITYQDF